jgi:acyl-CoA dehydrogenase
MVFKAASLYDRGMECGAEANAANYLAAEAALETREIAPISPHLILNFIAEKVLGLPKSY